MGPKRRKHQRRSQRRPGYDYTQAGAYFVTVCVQGWTISLGRVIAGKTILNTWGRIVDEEWLRTEELRANVALDEYVVMPDHFHGIIWIQYDVEEQLAADVGAQRAAPLQTSTPPKSDAQFPVHPHVVPGSLGAIMRGFKSAVTRRINDRRGTPGARFWQRNYNDHIIRNEAELQAIRRYIRDNPKNWNK